MNKLQVEGLRIERDVISWGSLVVFYFFGFYITAITTTVVVRGGDISIFPFLFYFFIDNAMKTRKNKTPSVKDEEEKPHGQ